MDVLRWMRNWIRGEPNLEAFLERKARTVRCECELELWFSDALDGSDVARELLMEAGADLERAARFVRKLQTAGPERLSWESEFSCEDVKSLSNWLMGIETNT